MKRTPTAELLDTDSGTAHEIVSSLRDLDRINRWFGGISASCTLASRVAQVTGLDRISLLEVAAGSGATPYAVQQRLRKDGVAIDLTLLDRASSHLAAGRYTDRNNGRAEIPPRLVVGDALKLPFRDGSFDVVSCNLFIHHLDPEPLAQFVNDALRVSRHAVLINDLSRSWLHLGVAYAGLPLFRSRITWHDAPASVEQAYTLDEMRRLLNHSNAAQVEIGSHYLFRIGAIAWKTRPGKA